MGMNPYNLLQAQMNQGNAIAGGLSQGLSGNLQHDPNYQASQAAIAAQLHSSYYQQLLEAPAYPGKKFFVIDNDLDIKMSNLHWLDTRVNEIRVKL